MTTQEMVSFIKNIAPEFGRAVIVTMINELQKNILGRESLQTVTHTIEAITTVDTERTVTFPDGTLTNNVRSVPVDGVRKLISQVEDREQYLPVSLIESLERTEDNPAQITFPFNPGDTTDVYYMLYFIWPTEVIAETINLVIPPTVHIEFATAVLKLIQNEDYGDESAWDYVDRRYIKRIVK